MNGGSGWRERCGPGWRRERKIPNWFMVLGREPSGLRNENGGAR